MGYQANGCGLIVFDGRAIWDKCLRGVVRRGGGREASSVRKADLQVLHRLMVDSINNIPDGHTCFLVVERGML